MRFLIGCLVALAVGCGNTATDDMQIDMALPADCPPLDSVGMPCNPACMYLGDNCGCSSAGVVTCRTHDMATHD